MNRTQLPLSVMQEALWVAWQLRPDECTDIITMPLGIEGEPDVRRLSAAVAALGRRFPLLRARVDSGPPPVLRWREDTELRLTHSRGGADATTEIERVGYRPFDLRVGPLARFELVDLDDRRILVLSVHHIAADGHSVLNLLGELVAAYAGDDLGEPAQTAAAVEFTRRQHELASGPLGAEHRDFWRRHLAADPPALRLFEHESQGRRSIVPADLEPELVEAVSGLAEAVDTSPFVVLFTAYLVTLHRHTGDLDLVVSIPTHGRRAIRGLHDTFGFFTNAVPVRIRLNRGERIHELTARVGRVLRDCLRHADLPQPAILRAAGLRRQDVRATVGRTLFQYWDTTVRDDLDVRALPLRDNGRVVATMRLLEMFDVTEFSLQSMVRVDHDGVSLLWKDNTGEVGEGVLSALVMTYRRTLAEFVADASARAVADAVPADIEPLELPLSPLTSGVITSSEVPLDGAVVAGLASALDLPVDVVLLAGFAGVLSWYCGQVDVALGLRRSADTVIPLNVSVDPGSGFRELTRHVAAAVTSPGLTESQLAGWLPESFHGRFAVLFDSGAGEPGPYRLRLQAAGEQPRLFADESDAGWLRDFGRHYARFLRLVAAEPDRPTGDIDPCGEDERNQELITWNDTDAKYPERSLTDLFRRQAERHSGRIALVAGDVEVSYGQLLADAEKLAAGLCDLGVRRGDLVGLQLPRGVDQVRTVLGILFAGAGYLPVDPAAPLDRREFVLADARVDLVVAAEDADLETVRAVAVSRLLADPGSAAPLPEVGMEDTAYCIYTSGTTGRPKGVVVSHRNVVRLVRTEIPRMSFGQEDVWTLFHAVHFDVSVWEMFGCLTSGGRLVLVPEELTRDTEGLLALLAKREVTVFGQTPTAFYQFAETATRQRRVLPNLRYVIFAGERLEPSRLAGWAEHHPDTALINMYGITETTVHSTMHRVSPAEIETGVSIVGRPLPTTFVYLLDRLSGRRFVPVGSVGEIHVGGLGVAVGYLRRAELTSARFIDDPFRPGRMFRSGDLARRRQDGTLEILGRADDQIKLRGYRIELGEIADALRRHPDVADAAVVLVGGSEGRLAAFVRSSDEQSVPDSTMRAHLGAILPPYMVPGSYQWWDGPFPLTRNGKLDRGKLTRWAEAPRPVARATPDIVAYGPLRTIAGVWAEVLDIPEPGPGDSFFDLGGHSLQAGQVAVRLSELAGTSIPLRTVLAHPVLADLAAAVADLHPAEPEPDSTPSVPERFAASSFQERIRLAARLAPERHRYLVPLLWRVRGPLDTERLGAALATLVRRHETLRTRFDISGGRNVQVVTPPWQPAVAEVWPEGPSALDDWVSAELAEPMDPESGRLLRCTLVHLVGEPPVLSLTLHHLVWDLGSLPVLLEELAAVMAGDSLGPAPQYREIVDAERAHTGSAQERADLSYWTEYLRGAPAYPSLRPPATPEPAGAVSVPARDDLGPRLRRLQARRGVTPLMAVATALCVTLHRWTTRDDLTLAIPVANRDLPRRAGIIGPCLNTIILRSTVDDSTTTGELLDSVREAVLNGLAYGRTPFERVVEECRPPRRADETPYSEVVLNLGTAETAELGAAVLDPVDSAVLRKYDTKFALTFTFTERDGHWTGRLSYRGDRSRAAEATALVDVLATVLHRLPDVLDHPVRAVDLVDPATLDRVVAFECPHPAASPTTVPTLLARTLREFGDRPAISGPEGDSSYAELDRGADRLATAFRAALTGDGPRVVALVLGKGPYLVMAMLASWRAGCAYCPIDPGYPAERIRGVLADLAPALVVTDSAIPLPAATAAPVLAPDGSPIAPVSPPTRAASATVGDTVVPSPDDPAYVIYTSGTSGRPKGVTVTHRGLAQLIRWHLRVFPLSPGDRASTVASVGFDACQWEHWPALVAGATVVVRPAGRQVQAEMAGWLRQNRINQAFLPTPLAEVVLADRPELPELRQLFFGGAALSAELPEDLNLPLCNAYGPTENTVVATAHLLDPSRSRSRAIIGRPIDGTTVYVVDAAGQRCPVGVPGEVRLAGDSVALGYWRQPALTEELFADADPDGTRRRVYRTGDLARWTEDGELEFVGRVDRQLEVLGHRIEPEEVEEALTGDPVVASAVVTVHNGRLVAYSTTRSAAEPDSAAVLARVARLLPAFMVPDALVWLPALPLTPHGKVDLTALPEPTAQSFRGTNGGAVPATEPERRIAAIWSEILGVGEVGVDDNFFDLGGNSLLLARLHARLETELEQRLAIVELFDHPTVRAMAARQRVDHRSAATNLGVLERARRQRARRTPSRDRRSGE